MLHAQARQRNSMLCYMLRLGREIVCYVTCSGSMLCYMLRLGRNSMLCYKLRLGREIVCYVTCSAMLHAQAR